MSKELRDKTTEAVKYMISVWDEVTSKIWRESPDHVQQKFLEAEKELKSKQPQEQEESQKPKSDCKYYSRVDCTWEVCSLCEHYKA